MLVARLAELDARSLEAAGGKAASLGELVRAGFPVPEGFVVTTEAYARVAALAGLDDVLAALAATPATDAARLRERAAIARERLLAAVPPDDVAAAVRAAYDALGGAVAVRSSATAEDLPGMSFAGQQDTYLDVRGREAVLDAIRRCWASLWNERAVAYRAAQGVDKRAVRIAVVVQRMVEPRFAGVLFTADSVRGTRRRTVVEAVPGLGEALVAGRAEPDRFVLDRRGAVLERRLAAGDRHLDDASLRALAELGARVEAHYGEPQDIEWAVAADGVLWLLQARPITTLYPLPANAPDPDAELRVYFSVNVAQGVLGPITPMGRQVFRLLSASLATLVGLPPRRPEDGAPVVVEAGERVFVDLTALVRDPLVRRILPLIGRQLEARSAAVGGELFADPRLAPRRRPRWRTLLAVLPRVARTHIPLHALRAFLHPDARRERVLREVRALELPRPGADASAAERLAAFERFALGLPPRVFPRMVGLILAGLGSYAFATRLLRDVATPAELQTVLRALPHDPTMEMDLDLWGLAERLATDAEAARRVREASVEELLAAWREDSLPTPLRDGFAEFLARYGHRAVAEIDIAVPRWSEDPAHLLGAVANYLRLSPGAPTPAEQFARGARAAEAMVDELARRARRRGWLRGLLARVLLRRVRALAGTREALKFHMIRFFAQGRALLVGAGEELARDGRLDAREDVFFLTLAEARAAAAGVEKEGARPGGALPPGRPSFDLRATVRARRAAFAREARRRHVPRLLLSDGTEPAAARGTDASTLVGTPASPGVVSAPARVILAPQGARLEPGEVLVAPSTDPGWTPLFLTAGGVVMEMGGVMSHGAVVAREYGIPAVVGVADATELIATGDRVTVDGTAGAVTYEGAAQRSRASA